MGKLGWKDVGKLLFVINKGIRWDKQTEEKSRLAVSKHIKRH